jgi:hypothetical protein
MAYAAYRDSVMIDGYLRSSYTARRTVFSLVSYEAVTLAHTCAIAYAVAYMMIRRQ